MIDHYTAFGGIYPINDYTAYIASLSIHQPYSFVTPVRPHVALVRSWSLAASLQCPKQWPACSESGVGPAETWRHVTR